MKKLVQGVHQFQEHAFQAHKQLFAGLAEGQAPHTLFITCSDSRINPNLLTQAEPGELFILRNPGNLVPRYGQSHSGEAAGIEYALTALSIEHIVVCGHSHCGAMKGLVSPTDLDVLPAMKAWLGQAERTRRVLHENYPEASQADLLNIAIQENVLVQLENLRSHPLVAERLQANRLQLYGWVYKLETGEVFAYDATSGQFEGVTEKLHLGTASELPRISASL